jgi:hypothetical protein
MPERPKHKQKIEKAGVKPEIISTRSVDERLCPPPKDAQPVDSHVHLRWIRKNARRISDMRRLYGYEYAEESDVLNGHGGYEGENGHIENGDLVLMRTGRDVVEDTEIKRREATAGMDRRQKRVDEAMGIEELEKHKVRTRGRKTFNIPVDL